MARTKSTARPPACEIAGHASVHEGRRNRATDKQRAQHRRHDGLVDPGRATRAQARGATMPLPASAIVSGTSSAQSERLGSTALPSRSAISIRKAPTVVNGNTGAAASRITCEDSSSVFAACGRKPTCQCAVVHTAFRATSLIRGFPKGAAWRLLIGKMCFDHSVLCVDGVTTPADGLMVTFTPRL